MFTMLIGSIHLMGRVYSELAVPPIISWFNNFPVCSRLPTTTVLMEPKANRGAVGEQVVPKSGTGMEGSSHQPPIETVTSKDQADRHGREAPEFQHRDRIRLCKKLCLGFNGPI